MRFKSDAQRRAIFANLYRGGNASPVLFSKIPEKTYELALPVGTSSEFNFPVSIKRNYSGETYIYPGEASTLIKFLKNKAPERTTSLQDKLQKGIDRYRTDTKNDTGEIVIDDLDIETIERLVYFDDKFTFSDEAVKKHNELMAQLGQKRREGVPVEELRGEFKDGMELFVLKRMPGEDLGDYLKRAANENKLVEDEVDYLSKRGALKR